MGGFGCKDTQPWHQEEVGLLVLHSAVFTPRKSSRYSFYRRISGPKDQSGHKRVNFTLLSWHLFTMCNMFLFSTNIILNKCAHVDYMKICIKYRQQNNYVYFFYCILFLCDLFTICNISKLKYCCDFHLEIQS